jgi:hypothetical protein
MPSFRTAFPSKYMKVADLNGRAVVATIASVDLEAVGTDNKYVARFTDDNVKPIVLNLTNSEAIAEIAGSEDVADWAGLKIEVFPSTTNYQGKRVGCIRIRAARQPAPGRSGASAPSRGVQRSKPKPADDIDEAMPTVADEDY